MVYGEFFSDVDLLGWRGPVTVTIGKFALV